MFQSLRQNSLVYIFHKGAEPYLETGTVTNFPVVKPKYNIPATYGQQLEMVVDITVKVGDKINNFNQLPANLDLSDSNTYGENIVISDNKDAINQEVLNYKQRSVDALNDVEQHKNIIKMCDNIYKDFNPEYAEKVQLQNDLSNLKSQMSEMTKSITALTELVGQLTRKENRNEQNVGNNRG